jgi:RNA polymerase sigma factor (TIGR02999 family)
VSSDGGAGKANEGIRFNQSLVKDVTTILKAIEQGEPHAAEQLLPLVYDELRRLASEKMAQEKPGQTLQATALVHEAYLRLVNTEREQHWNSRGHFFAAAAEAMRRILVERARSKRRVKRGGGALRLELDEHLLVADDRVDEILAVHEVLDQLERHDAQAAALVKLRFFAGFEHQEAAGDARPEPPGSRSPVAAGPHLAVPSVGGGRILIFPEFRVHAASICRTEGRQVSGPSTR